MLWHPEELDADLPLGWRTRIAHQALCPREPKVRPLRPRKDHRRRRGAVLAGRVFCKPHLDVLITHKLLTGTSMLSPTPVTPEEGGATNDERVRASRSRGRGFASGFAIRTLHCSRRGQGRQLWTLAAYTTRRLPSPSLRRTPGPKRLPSRTAQC